MCGHSKATTVGIVKFTFIRLFILCSLSTVKRPAHRFSHGESSTKR
jgi:hypothetical protein